MLAQVGALAQVAQVLDALAYRARRSATPGRIGAGGAGGRFCEPCTLLAQLSSGKTSHFLSAVLQ